MKSNRQTTFFTKSRRVLYSAAILFLSVLFLTNQTLIKADTAAFALAQGTSLSQNWTNTGLITTDDNWAGVPSIIGYRGDDLTMATATDPQTILADGSGTPVDVIANQTNPNTNATGGVAEFDTLANPVVALQGSGTADAPHIEIRLNTTACASPANRINVTYNIRDIDGSTDNAVQPVALQYRVGGAGSFTNIPAGFVADATTGPSLATLVTPIALTLPTATQGQAQVQLRIMTTNAVGNDEWVGIDDINVVCGVPSAASASIGGQVRTPDGRGIGKTTVTLTGGSMTSPRTAITNGFGYYQFDNVAVGDTYVISASSKRYTFQNPTRVVSLKDNLGSEDFVSNEP